MIFITLISKYYTHIIRDGLCNLQAKVMLNTALADILTRPPQSMHCSHCGVLETKKVPLNALYRRKCEMLQKVRFELDRGLPSLY